MMSHLGTIIIIGVLYSVPHEFDVTLNTSTTMYGVAVLNFRYTMTICHKKSDGFCLRLSSYVTENLLRL